MHLKITDFYNLELVVFNGGRVSIGPILGVNAVDKIREIGNDNWLYAPQTGEEPMLIDRIEVRKAGEI